MATSFSYAEFTTRNLGFVTAEQQKVLEEAHVFVGGVGGMGGSALACLIRSGIGQVTIADLDDFEVSNLNRQMFATMDSVGHPKVQTTADAIKRINPECVVNTLDGTWVQQLDTLLPKVSIAVNGCDDTRASVALMRAGQRHGKTVVDAFASPLPNVYVVKPQDPRPEVTFGYPTVGKPLEQIDTAMAAECLGCEIEWVMTHSSSVNHVDLGIAGEVLAGKRKRMSFAPMVWVTGCLMAYEVIRALLELPGGAGPAGVFINPWTYSIERATPSPWSAVKRFFVRRFMKAELAKAHATKTP